MTSSDHGASIRDFFAAWGKSQVSLIEAFENHLADQVTWLQPGLPDVSTRSEGVALMKSLHDSMGLETIGVDFPAFVVDGNVVISERVDTLFRADGSQIASFDVVGVMRLDSEGRIAHWREYFDPTPLAAMFGG